MNRSHLVVAVVAVGALAGCTFDPVASNAIDALGDEAPGVREGPTHRPGQPCLLCHDGKLFDPPEFSVAGTVFTDPVSLGGADGTSVMLSDSAGSTYLATTNTVGNFYVTPAEWSPTFPLSVSIFSTTTVTMQSQIGRNGACAGCHVSPAGPASPGPVVLMLANGETPP